MTTNKDMERMMPGAHWARTRERIRKEYRRMAMVGVAGVAEEFGVSDATVRRRVREGQIPHVRIGRQLRFDLEECREFFSRQGVRLSEEQAVSETLRRC